jgi:hypothetical protein
MLRLRANFRSIRDLRSLIENRRSVFAETRTRATRERPRSCRVPSHALPGLLHRKRKRTRLFLTRELITRAASRGGVAEISDGLVGVLGAVGAGVLPATVT